MTKSTILATAGAAGLAVAALAAACVPLQRDATEAEAASAAVEAAPVDAEVHPSFIHGRITTVRGEIYQGRLRFGATEEAFWGDYFNGFKDGNEWADYAPPGAVPDDWSVIRFLGYEIVNPWPRDPVRRPLMVRFGDIVRIDAHGRDLRVTLKNGTRFNLDRYAADDFADGVRVWDAVHGVVDLDERQVRSIELLPPTHEDATPPHRLHGTVRTRSGEFTGFVQWGRAGSVGLDELSGRSARGEPVRLPFITIRSIERAGNAAARVTLLDGREIELSEETHASAASRGIFVDDARYGRVLVPWDAFDRLDFSDAGSVSESGPSYDSFPASVPITGAVTTRSGQRIAGRLVFDLDESETIQTLDAPSGGVQYTIPFGLVETIALPGVGAGATGHVGVTLHGGEVLRLERRDDLGDDNAGLLVFPAGQDRAQYVPWSDVARVDLDRPGAMYPPRPVGVAG